MRYIILAVLVLVSCASTPPYKTIRPLTYIERVLVREITKQAQHSQRKDYYLAKLQALLNTPEATPDQTKKMIVEHTEDGVIKAAKLTIQGAEQAGESVTSYTTREERYESTKLRHWTKQHPHFWGPYYWVAKDDPKDLLVHLKVRLVGDPKQIDSIVAVEDNTEKHLGVPGFSVNIEYVAVDGSDVFTIGADPTKWPSSVNWGGGNHLVYSHELGHTMGLDDEYDLIESHAQNPYISIQERLSLFLYGMLHPRPTDADQGIMSDPRKQLLPRHICAAVELGKDCIKVRETLRTK